MISTLYRISATVWKTGGSTKNFGYKELTSQSAAEKYDVEE